MSGSERDLLEIVRRVAAAAQPGEQIEAYAMRSREVEVEVFGGEVESLSIAGVDGVGVRVISGGRAGFAWAGSLDDDIVTETIGEARDNASFAEIDEWVGVATPDDAASAPVADLDLYRPDFLDIPVERKVALALELEQAVKAGDSRIRVVESAGYGDSAVESAIANSLGVSASSRRTVCSASASAIADDGSGPQTGFGFSAGRAFADLDPDEIVRDTIHRSTRLLGAKQTASRRIPVVLDPLVTRSLLGVISSAFNGEAMLKGRSMFTDRLGEQVAAAHVQIVDDPTDARMMGAARFDSEGVPTRRNALIADGVLQGFLHNTYTARRAGGGQRTTGSAVRGGFKSATGVGVRALRLEPGPLSPQEILASVPEALYVQGVSGLHSGTNPISGDFSVGAEGLMVRGGALAEAVREVTIASTLQRMLADLVHVGSDLTFLPGAAAGQTVLIGEMTLSGA